MAVDNVLFSTVEDRPTEPDLASYLRVTQTEVNNSTTTAITCPLDRATKFRAEIKPGETAQAFTITFPNDDALIVASGGFFEFETPEEFGSGDTLFEVQTETGTVDLQLTASRPHLYPRNLV